MELSAQLSGFGGNQRVIEKEQIRAVQTHIVKSAVTFDASADVAGHSAEHGGTKAVMGISCGHWVIPFLVFVYSYFTRFAPKRKELFCK
jgi:hypothetical protein